MTRPDSPPIPLAADERTSLLAFLDFLRADFVDRAFGLDHAQLQMALAPSSLTLSRLIGHMALVEGIWFRVRFAGQEEAATWEAIDWDADPDGEMALSQTWTVEELHDRFAAAVDDSNTRIEAASSLDQLSAGANREGEHWNLRWILVHMIEEYARHCGHADLIRESIDGDTAR